MKNAVKPERKFWQDLKKNTCSIQWNRIENLSLLGMPDVLGYTNSGHFFTLELKVTRGNKLKFSPHQIAFHVAHPHNTFILAEALGPRLVKLFPGSRIKELVACGFKLEACSLGLEACVSYLDQVGSKA